VIDRAALPWRWRRAGVDGYLPPVVRFPLSPRIRLLIPGEVARESEMMSPGNPI